MKKGLLFLLLSVLTLGAWADDVTAAVDNISSYSGTASYVYNKADGKVYARNNTGAYERYGVYEKVISLNVAFGEGIHQISYIATKSEDGTENVPYLNTGYTPKANTRIVLDVDIESSTAKDWMAVFGARQGGWGNNAFVLFARTAKDGGWNKGCYNRSGDEHVGTTDIPRGQRMTIDASGNLVTFTVNGSEVARIEATGTVENCTNNLYIFDTNTAGANGNQRDNSYIFMKLYGCQIYEGETLVKNFVPVYNSSTSKGGMKDLISGNVIYSSSSRDFAVSDDANDTGTTVYNGKMVYNTSDNKVYKYNGSEFVLSGDGNRTLSSTISGTYQNMNNWVTNDGHMSIFRDKWTATANGYKIDPYEGTSGHEPLMIKVGTEINADYNYSFTASWGAYGSWHSVEMHAYICNFWDLNTQESGLSVSNSVLATKTFAFTGGTNVPFSLDFTADREEQTLVFQFGDVDDGSKGYWFEFDNLSVKKYVYPEAYPDLEVAIKSIAWAKDKGFDISIAETLLAQTIVENTGSPKDIVVLALKQSQAETSPQPTIFTMVSESVVGTNDNNYGTSVNDRADGFYVYNVGTGRWFCGGDDWGAHAAVGFPGIKVTTPKNDYGSGHYNSVVTWLCNGNWGTKCQLNHNGYCDTDGNGWKFFKQNAAQGIYTWAKNGNNSGDNSSNGYGTKDLVGFAPSSYARVNTDRTGADDPYNQWIFVTEAQRDEMAADAWASASESNPVDLTYKIKMPGLNQRERKEGTNQDSEELDWTCNHTNYLYSDGRKIIMGRNDNHADFVCDIYGVSWNDAFSWTQTVTGLTPGRYRVKVQGYNNNGETANKACLVANGQKVALVERSSESVLPWTTKLPENTFDNPEYFQVGCYWNSVICTVGSNGELTLGVESPSITGSHVVIFDNFRLEYVGLSGVTVGDVNYTTFVAPYNIETIPDGVEAYACQVNANSVHLEQVDAIPEGEAVVLKNKGSYTFAPASGAVELGTSNDLLASDGTAEGDGANIFALANKANGVGFYLVDNGVKVPAGKGYLNLSGAGVKAFYGFDDDDATAIEKTLSNSPLKGENIYNLAGQRIQKMQKGVNIVNGKKVLY